MKDIIVWACGLNAAMWFVLFTVYSDTAMLGVSAVMSAVFFLSIGLTQWNERKKEMDRIRVKGMVDIDEDSFTSIFNKK